MQSALLQAWIRQLPEPHSLGFSPPSIVYPESSYSNKTATIRFQDVVSSLPSPSPSPPPPPPPPLSGQGRGGPAGNAARKRLRPTTANEGLSVRKRPCTSHSRRPSRIPVRPKLPSTSRTVGRTETTSRDAGSVELGRGWVDEASRPGQRAQNPIDISSYAASSSSFLASSRHSGNGGAGRKNGDSSPFMSSPVVAAAERRRKQRALRTPSEKDGGEEAMPGSVVRSIEGEGEGRGGVRGHGGDDERAEPQQQRIREVKRESEEVGIRVEDSIMPSIEGAEDEAQGDGTVEGRYSFNTKHLELLSSEDLLWLQQRGRQCDGQIQNQTPGNPEPPLTWREPEKLLKINKPLQTNRPSQANKPSQTDKPLQINKPPNPSTPKQRSPPCSELWNPSTQEQEKRDEVILRDDSSLIQITTPIPVSTPPTSIQPDTVTFDDAETDPVASLLAVGATDANFTAFLQRILSLRAGRAVFPRELSRELQTETGLRLTPSTSHPEATHDFMLDRAALLGFRLGTSNSSEDTNHNNASLSSLPPSTPCPTLTNARHLLSQAGPQAALKFELRFELEVLQAIVHATRRCFDASLHQSQPGSRWAAEVQVPLLQLAARYVAATGLSPAGDAVEDRNVTGVRLVNMAATGLHARYAGPGGAAAEMTRGLVNYALVLAPEPRGELDTGLRRAVRRFGREEREEEERRRDSASPTPSSEDGQEGQQHLEKQGQGPDGWNPTVGDATIRYSPIGTAVLMLDPSTSCRQEQYQDAFTARARIALWGAAWRARLREFVDLRQTRDVVDAVLWDIQRSQTSSGGGAGDVVDGPPAIAVCRMIPLPVVVMNGAECYLYFVVECERRRGTDGELDGGLRITQPLFIGSTRCLVEAYKLLAILREIVNWLKCDFTSWINELV